MPTKPSMDGLFLVNGVKCAISVNGECISWWPVKINHDSKFEKDKRTKSIEFVQIVGIKKLPLLSRGETACSERQHHKISIETKLQNKIKVYYSKQNENKSTGRLLKLKKLSIELPARKKTHLQKWHIPSAIIHNENQLATVSKEAQLQVSEPPSCYASEGSTGRLSSLSSQSVTSTASPSSSPTQDLVGDESSSLLSLNKAQQTRSLEKLSQHLENKLELQRKQRPRRLLIFVNPFGGKGKALHLYKSQVRRLLELAEIETKLVVTKYANHARDTIEDPLFNVDCFDGIVCVGGDGMFSELMNGLVFRFNKEKILADQMRLECVGNGGVNDISDSKDIVAALKTALGGIGQQFVSPPIPVGVIGAGSTDANSFGLIGTNDVITATLNIILGNQIKIDVCSIHSIREDRLLRFVSTFVAYGYFGDVIRESENLRWLGPSRYDVTGVNNLIKNRTYKGQVKILTSSQDGSPLDVERCHNNCQLCNDSKERQQNDLKLRFMQRRGSFIGINAAVTACRCPQTKKGFSPYNHLANGCADLILVRPCTRIQYIQYLLRTGWTKKSAFDLKYVEAFRCRQFEFVADHEPVESSSSSGSSVDNESNSNSLDSKQSSGLIGSTFSSWNVDGEILNEQSIRVKVNNQLLRVFGTGEPELCEKSKS